jgi:hypothetical protein
MSFLDVWGSVIPLADEVAHFKVLFRRQSGGIRVVITEIANGMCYPPMRNLITEFHEGNWTVAIKVVPFRDRVTVNECGEKEKLEEFLPTGSEPSVADGMTA